MIRYFSLDDLPFTLGSYYVFDRGYLDFRRLRRITQAEAWFVIRSKCNTRFYVCESRPVDKATDLSLVFLTNNFALPALVVAAIYRRRWEIELLFRWIKQHLRLRGFFSTCPNGVAVQIWTAICAYLLVAIAKREMALPGSLHQVLQIVSISALEKVPLPELFTKDDETSDMTDTFIQLEINGF